jgi:hypothetical protein
MQMDFGKAFGFVFEDEEWIKKILVGALISLVPVVGQFVVFGWGLAVLRNVQEGRSRPLPDWGEFGEFLAAGAKYWVVTMVYAIPILILICPVTITSVVPALGGGSEDLTPILGGVAAILGIGLVCLMAAYGVLMALLMPALQIRFAETGEIGPCLRFGEVFGYMRRNIGPIFVAVLVATVAGGALVSLVGGVTLGLLALPASVWATAFSSHLYGQIARDSSGDEPGEDFPVLNDEVEDSE